MVVIFTHTAVPACPVGGDGGEEDSGSSSQQVYCFFGLRLPVQNRAVSGDDHHERRRPEVRSHSLSLGNILTTVVKKMGSDSWCLVPTNLFSFSDCFE